MYRGGGHGARGIARWPIARGRRMPLSSSGRLRYCPADRVVVADSAARQLGESGEVYPSPRMEKELTMISIIVLIKKLNGVSTREFIDYYENRHAPMIDKLLPYYTVYKRNYPTRCLYPGDTSRSFDAITELAFKDQAAFDAWLDALQDPEVIDLIRRDEANFLDSSATQMWLNEIDGSGPAAMDLSRLG